MLVVSVSLCIIYAVVREIRRHKDIRGNYGDYKGIPTAVCPCGSDLLTIQAQFDEAYEITAYLLNAHCAYCGAELTAPTPLDLIEDL